MKVVFVELFIFTGILMLSATARNEKITFSPIFRLKAMWFVYAPYMLIFCILYFKAVVMIFEIQICSKLSSFGLPKGKV
jgi:hypothetical protein